VSTPAARMQDSDLSDMLPADAPLSEHISIGAGFRRSINLERDQNATELLQSYVPTSRALAALEQIADGLEGRAASCALALIGPYGGGKSAFALFSGALLGPPNAATTRIAATKLRQAAPALARRITAAVNGSTGLLRVQVNGIPDSLIRQLMLALARAAEQAALPETLVKRVQAAARPGTRMDHVIDLIVQARDAWVAAGGGGLLVEIDELGKFLELEAQGSGQREIHLLQMLAEKAAEPGVAPLCVMVMLHQAFEHYSARLGKSLRDEWKKVQGRFSAIAFLEPAEQTLRVTAAAFNRNAELGEVIKTEIYEVASRLTECSALPLGLDLAAATELFEACYPLHPTTLLMLPILCQRVAQNERTLFSYLASTEHFGFGRRLQELRSGEWVGPWELFDYFILNQAGEFSDPLTYHRWVEVITALERYVGNAEGAGDEPAVRLLKTIGLLNLVGAQRGLKASDAVLRLLFADALDGLLAALQSVSIIHFRGYAQEFRVWQGSDFDLHAALEQAAAEQTGRVLADTLNALAPLPPLVARRASIETGTLRSFQVQFTSAERWPPAATDAELSLWLYLAEPGERPELSGAPERAVVAVCRSTERLRELVAEWQALVDLPRQHAQLQQDAVAKREHQAWLDNAEADAIGAIRALLESPEHLCWHFGGEHRTVMSRRALQAELSDWVMHHCFPLTPLIRNELINRERPSAAASTARNKLLAAMLTAADQDGLGIAKTPAEKSLYLSLLHESRLHRPGADGRWDFLPPAPLHDPCRIGPAWRAIDQTLGEAGQRQVSVPDVYRRLQEPPFGLRPGVLPILMVTYLIARRREIALYQEGAFSERLGIAQAELLCRRPALFAIERFELKGLRAALFQQYLGSIVGNLTEDATLLDIVRPLMRFAQQLPEYSQHCSGLSAEAERVRTVFRQAKSPGQMLFKDLPRACGFDPAGRFADDEDEPSAGEGKTPGAAVVEPFIARLIAVLRELNGAYPALLAQWHSRLGQALLQRPAVGDLADTRAALAERYQGLDRYAAQQGAAGAFIRRLCEGQHQDQAWLESLMTLLAKAPPAKWRDSQRVNAELRLDEMAAQLTDLEVLCRSVPRAELDGPGSRDTFLLKLVRAGCEERRHLVRLDARQREAANAAAEDMEQKLAGLEPATRAAVLAQLMERLLPDESALAVTQTTNGEGSHD
jgi:hypothetical protein